jgi:YVTN family beta-propeller protein
MKGKAMVRRTTAVSIAALLMAGATVKVTAEQAAPPAYKLVQTIPLGPAERWDYATFDPSQGRVYVAHGDQVTVVNAATGAIIGNIGPLPGGTHGIDVSPENGIGFTDDGDAGIAAAFDLNTLKILKRIPTAPDADGVNYDPVSRHIFVINGDSGSITVIDPKSQDAIATIKVGAGLEAGIVDGKGKFFVDGAEQHDIIAIDTRTNAVLAHYPMAACQRPHGIAVDSDTRRVFSTCINKLMVVMDADNGRIVAQLPIGTGTDGATFDPKRKLALSSNGEGTISVVQEQDANHFVALPDLATQRSARTIAIDPSTGRLFLPAADIAKIDPPTTPGGRPHTTYVPGSAKLLVFAPTR